MPLQTVDVPASLAYKDDQMYDLKTMLPFGDEKASLAPVVAAVTALSPNRRR